ncbi:flavin reductase family protein [Kitasatospora sp. GP82]|uniref:flavin reductase family protein n=1 Tax=Kitasatospora sp. GP82 TaxID=3035089 RepID=UPI002474E591|nr:flavin reductase family protein [Kitasatospora sp. GP82]MDH6128778.1 flavin reductase (DIM6/NTAB) family NADH-FMN oxidoreductase RutF [Kitasatospora sp. GP82]
MAESPILAETLAWLESGLAATYDGCDHSIFLGSVLALGQGLATQPLLCRTGTFHRLDPDTP